MKSIHFELNMCSAVWKYPSFAGIIHETFIISGRFLSCFALQKFNWKRFPSSSYFFCLKCKSKLKYVIFLKYSILKYSPEWLVSLMHLWNKFWTKMIGNYENCHWDEKSNVFRFSIYSFISRKVNECWL